MELPGIRSAIASLVLAFMVLLLNSGSATESIDISLFEEEVTSLVTFDGYNVVNALFEAYPGLITETEIRSGFLAVKVNNVWFLWKDGALIPENKPDLVADPHSFYVYPEEVTPPPDYSDEEKETIAKRSSSFRENPPQRTPAFFDTLWNMKTESEAWRNQKKIRFLGYSVTVNKYLVDKYAAIEKEISLAAKIDPSIKLFLSNIFRISGWNWREIAGTENRSFHAYGVAMDFEPRKTGNKYHYWRWRMDVDPYWFTLPLDRRIHPPKAIVEAFERQGFAWGGKWFFYDSLHFEYRPEILLLNGFNNN